MMANTLYAGIKSLREGAWYARYQYRRFRHHERLCRERDAAYASYQASSPQRLHLGAELFVLPDWFNTDLDPRSQGIYYVDATEPLPFPNASFDFIFFEHMIEHIPFADGLKLLGECRRILRGGGVVRVATPDLSNILALLSASRSETEAYLSWAVETFDTVPKSPFPKAPGVINNFFRSWGHQFIYDAETLRTAMEQAGLIGIKQCKVGESAHPPLRSLERHGERWSPWVNEYETMILEGTAALPREECAGLREDEASPVTSAS